MGTNETLCLHIVRRCLTNVGPKRQLLNELTCARGWCVVPQVCTMFYCSIHHHDITTNQSANIVFSINISWVSVLRLFFFCILEFWFILHHLHLQLQLEEWKTTSSHLAVIMAWGTQELAPLFNKRNIVPFSKFVRKVFKTRFPNEEQSENWETADRERQER